jgi:isopentenyldiphosphate isomerase
VPEYFDLIDDRGRVIGRATREECHGNPSLVHRVAHVLVFNARGELYLQKRAMTKDVQPGKWDTSVGGHLALGEGYDSAAARELREELGVAGVELEGPLYEYRMRSPIETEAVRSYRVFYDGPIRPDPGEIDEGRFWSLGEIRARLGSGIFTPNFEEELGRYLAWATSCPRASSPGPIR